MSAQRHFACSGKSGMRFDTNERQRLAVSSWQSPPPPNYPRPTVNSTTAGCFIFAASSLKTRQCGFSFARLYSSLETLFHTFFALSETRSLAFVSVVEDTCPLPNKTVPCKLAPPSSQMSFQTPPSLRFSCRHPRPIVSCMGLQYTMHESTTLKLLSSEPRLY